MKYLFMIISILGCTKNSPSVRLFDCERMAKELGANFSYINTTEDKAYCSVSIEGNEFQFASNDMVEGIRFGLVMHVNRPKLKEYKACMNLGTANTSKYNKYFALSKHCRNKLGMKDWD